LNFPRQQAKLAAAAAAVEVPGYRSKNRHETFPRCYRKQNCFCICSDVRGLMEELGFVHTISKNEDFSLMHKN
jgi:hypothetical protein